MIISDLHERLCLTNTVEIRIFYGIRLRLLLGYYNYYIQLSIIRSTTLVHIATRRLIVI